MKKCQTCRYGSEYELDKPCIVYREDCPLYQKVGDEMTREEAIKYFEHHMEFYCVTGVCKEAEEMAIKALKQEPSGDLISRQAVIELLFNAYTKTELTSIGYASKEYAELCVNELMELPSIHPQEPKTGHWIEREHGGVKCSKCLIVFARPSIFCPNCGCRMVEPQESEETDADSN